jgi:glycosyltransferase involved in cell wall biosynthesis
MSRSKSQSVQVSVLLPSYNAGSALLLAVKSLIFQKFENWELLLIDDGSTDNSIDSIRQMNDQRIRIFEDNQNKGLAFRLNQGVKFSRGQYIARMDSDDICFPNRLQRQVDFLNDHPSVDLVSSKAIVFTNIDYKLIGVLPFVEFHNDLVRRPWKTIFMPHPTWMGKKSWFERFEYKLPETIRAEDQELLIRSYSQSNFYSIPEILLAYRQGDFSFKRTWISRKALLGAQLRLFFTRFQFWYLICAVVIFLIKVLIDLLASFPFASKLFFLRMSGKIDVAARKEFYSLLEEINQI